MFLDQQDSSKFYWRWNLEILEYKDLTLVDDCQVSCRPLADFSPGVSLVEAKDFQLYNIFDPAQMLLYLWTAEN